MREDKRVILSVFKIDANIDAFDFGLVAGRENDWRVTDITTV